MEEKKKITLTSPVVIPQSDGSEKIYSEVFVSKLKNKHLKYLPKDFFDGKNKGKIPPNMIPGLIAAVCEIPKEVAGEITIDDTFTILEEMESFFQKSPTTGGNTSG